MYGLIGSECRLFFICKMGKRNRERKERIKAGKELPRSATDSPRRPKYFRYFRCRTCGHFVIETGLEKHKEECKTRGFVLV